MRSSTLRSAGALTAAAFVVAGVNAAGNAELHSAFYSSSHASAFSSVLDPSYDLVSNVSATANSTITRSVVTVLQTLSVCADSAGNSGSSSSSSPLIGTSYGSSLTGASSSTASTTRVSIPPSSIPGKSIPRTSLGASGTSSSSIHFSPNVVNRFNDTTNPSNPDTTGTDTSTRTHNGTDSSLGPSSPHPKPPTHTALGNSSVHVFTPTGVQSGDAVSTGSLSSSSKTSPSGESTLGSASPTRSTTRSTSTKTLSTKEPSGSASPTRSTATSTSTRRPLTKESSPTPNHPTSPGQSPSSATTSRTITHGEGGNATAISGTPTTKTNYHGEAGHSGTPSTTTKGQGSTHTTLGGTLSTSHGGNFTGIIGIPSIPTITPGPISTSFTGPITTNYTEINVTSTTTTANSTAPIFIGSIRKKEAESEVSSASTYFLKILPTLSQWELKPDPPLQTDIINKIKGFEDDVKNLALKINGNWEPECPPIQKRGLMDGLINSVANVVSTGAGATNSVLSALNCIGENTKRLVKGVENRNVENVKGIVDTLTGPEPPNIDNPEEDDPKDEDSPSTTKPKTSTKLPSASTTKTKESTTKTEDEDNTMTTKPKSTTKSKDDDNSTTTGTKTTTKPKDDDRPTTATKTTTTCTKHTAHHVTVLCSPTFSTVGTVTKASTTCSPTTTLTTTGCSASDTTTTVTSTPTPTGRVLCEPEGCGNSCSYGKGGWVTIAKIDCDKISTSTGALPTKSQVSVSTVGKGVARRDEPLEERQNDPDSLPNLEPNSQEQSQYVKNLAAQISREHMWISQQGDITAEYFPIGNEKLAAGVKPLYGCTAVVIVSRRGVYISHLFENPMFSYREDGDLYERSDELFEFLAVNGIINGSPNYPGLDPLNTLVGSDNEPGPLHRSLEPLIFVISPFRENNAAGPFQHANKVNILSDRLCKYIYGSQGCPYERQHKVGYQVAREVREGSNSLTAPQVANNDNYLSGKVIFEMTPLNHRAPDGEYLQDVGRWRLWSNGNEVISIYFWDLNNRIFVGAGGRAQRRDGDDKGSYKGVCPPKSNNGTYCAKGSCGDSCAGGSGDWLDLGPIDCAKIPTSTLASLPAPTKGITAMDYGLVGRADNNPQAELDPLPALPPPPTDLNPGGGPDKYIQDLAVRFTQRNLWLNLYGNTETTFQWRAFGNKKAAIGMKSLTGCTGLFIVSTRGIFMAHFWEDPTIALTVKDGKIITHLPGDIIRDTVNVIAPEIRRLVESGDLHHSLEPKIYMVSPFTLYETSGPLLYRSVLDTISPLVSRLIYPEEVASGRVRYLGYQRTQKELAHAPIIPSGKAIMEGTPLTKYYEGPRGILPVGQIRFWVGGKLMIDQELYSPKDAADAGFGGSASTVSSSDSEDDLPVVWESDDDDLPVVWDKKKRASTKGVGVCPMPTKTSTKTTPEPTTTKTTKTSTKSTTKATTTKSTTKSTPKPTSTKITKTSTTKTSPKPTSTKTSKTSTTKTSTTISTTKPTTKTSTTKTSTTKTSTTKSTTKKPSTLATTTKSKHETNTKNPGGQPPGFTLPTYKPPPTTKATSTSSDDPRPTHVLGEVPDGLDPACEIRQWGSGHLPEYNRELYEKITNMCADKISDKDKDFDEDSKSISWTANTSDKKIYYYAEVSWSDGCGGDSQNVLKPKSGLDCKTALRANFQGCRPPSFGGGTTTVGCISYQLRQGKDDN